MKKYYNAVFQTENVGYSVWINDICGVVSQGETFDEAVENIKDALGLYIEDAKQHKEEIPKPYNPTDIILENGQFTMVVEFDWLEYQKKHSNKSIKKTLSIPAWLNTIAEENNLNFSAVLRKALVSELEMQDKI